MKKIFLLFLISLPLIFYSQYVLKNEQIIYSFKTINGKLMFLVKDKENKYIQYRFGTNNKIELEFPAERNKDSWKKFYLNTYYRGGGKENSGMELEYLHFFTKHYQYSIYREYHAEDESFETGILIRDLKGNVISNVKSIYKSINGNLNDLNDKVSKEDYGF